MKISTAPVSRVIGPMNGLFTFIAYMLMFGYVPSPVAGELFGLTTDTPSTGSLLNSVAVSSARGAAFFPNPKNLNSSLRLASSFASIFSKKLPTPTEPLIKSAILPDNGVPVELLDALATIASAAAKLSSLLPPASAPRLPLIILLSSHERSMNEASVIALK